MYILFYFIILFIINLIHYSLCKLAKIQNNNIFDFSMLIVSSILGGIYLNAYENKEYSLLYKLFNFKNYDNYSDIVNMSTLLALIYILVSMTYFIFIYKDNNNRTKR